MEQYVDWFGFMAYDLHGSWDAEVKTIGALVRAQTDLRDITNNTLPLWFDKLDPAKVNLGLAYYGRGFTLAEKLCNYIGCAFSGPSKPVPCTNFEGVMSHREIKQLIKEKGLTPTLILEVQVTWHDQWIEYDDMNRMAAKIRMANSLFFLFSACGRQRSSTKQQAIYYTYILTFHTRCENFTPILSTQPTVR